MITFNTKGIFIIPSAMFSEGRWLWLLWFILYQGCWCVLSMLQCAMTDVTCFVCG